MTRVCKAFLILEVLVCFLPATIYLFLGAILTPLQLYLLITTPWSSESTIASLAIIAATLTGFAGLVAVLNIMKKILRPTVTVIDRKTLILCGLLPAPVLLMIVFWLEPAMLKLLALAPLLSGVHISYVGKEFIFGTK